jgi:hypothetical protein|tara:strand:- start:1049 stop:1342 length:294 start_codon:yes stop_codon:yes gene_type:complete
MATKGTNAKIKELKGVKPESISKEQLDKVQSVVNRINQAQMDIGQLESRKHQALHYIAGINDELTLLQEELKKEYGTDDVNIKDGTINYEKDVKADS